MKRLTTASLTLLAFFMSTTAAASPDHNAPVLKPTRPYCHQRLFTVKQTKRAANVVYRGTRQPTRRNMRMLGQMERCQRNPAAQQFVRWYDRHQAALHDQRVYDAQHPWSSAQVSWFDDGQSAPACGDLAPDGVASRDYPCGTKVEFRWGGRTVTAVVDDYGPASWTGRMWDLDQTTASDLGFIGTDVGAMDYRVR